MTFFTHRALQDLSWVIRSAPLVSGQLDGTDWWTTDHLEREYQACLPQLIQLDKQPTRLQQVLTEVKSYRLGHYFESLVAFWLEISPTYNLLASHVPLRREGHTLGEMDFIIQEKSSGRIIHLEVAVKFYLGHGHLNHMTSWHGPGLRDRLDIKFERLHRHQTRLSHKYPELMPHMIDATACLLKGRLFYPPEQPPGTDFGTPGHLHGHWHYTPPAISAHDTQKVWLNKQSWLAAIYDTGQPPPDIPLQSMSKNQPECYANLQNGKEQQRYFVLPRGFWSGVQTPDSAVEPTQ